MSSPVSVSYLPSVFLGSAAFVFLNFSLPVRADDLGIDAVGIGGMYAVFTGTVLLVRPVVGWCLDRYGRRWFFASSFLFYAAAMLLFSRSEVVADFYLARFVQGLGASAMWIAARTIIADVTDADRRGSAMGQLTVTSIRGSMVGAAVGFTLLGMMPMREAWFWAFGGYSVLALLGLIWAVFRVPETRPAQTATRAEPLRVTPALRQVLLIVFLTAFASALIEPLFLIYLKNKFELPMLAIAFAFLPAGLVYALVPSYAGRWSDRYGRARIIAVGLVLAACMSAALPFWPSIYLVAGFYILFAAGSAMAGPAEEALTADLAPEASRGAVMGAREASAGVGAALGPLAGGLVYEHVSPAFAFLANGVLLVLAAGLAWRWFRQGGN